MTDRIDQQLGNYRLIQYVGGGGFADVYLGGHVHLNTLAAIKVLHTQLLASEVGRFREEARTVARLAHPNIVRVLDFGIDGTIPFLVMEYEWLCGECPFHGSPMEIWGQQLFAPPPPLREKVPMILPKVEEVILTALAKDPKQRFERVHAFASALEQAVQEELPEPATPSQEVSSSPQLTITTSLQSQGSQRKMEKAPIDSGSSLHETINTHEAVNLFRHFMQPDSRTRVLLLTGEAKMGKRHLLTKVFPVIARQEYQTRYAILDLRNKMHTVPDILQMACSQFGVKNCDDYYSAPQAGIKRSNKNRHLTAQFVNDPGKLDDRLLLLLFESVNSATENIQAWLMDTFLVQLSLLDHIRMVVAGRSLPEA